jgi:hypothetical protein
MPTLPEHWTIYLRIWTGQKCLACGAVFHYLRRFTVPRSQTLYEATAASVEAEYVQGAKTSAAVFPCPQCGYIQPDMIATRKAVCHGILTFAAFILLLINTLAAAFGLLPHDVAAAIAFGITIVALLSHGYYVFADPNRDRPANLARAQAQVQKDNLRLVQPGTHTGPLLLPFPLASYVNAGSILIMAGVAFYIPVFTELPYWPCQIAGIILFIWSGSTFANTALRLKEAANPREIIEVNSTQVTDDSIPEDFRKK